MLRDTTILLQTISRHDPHDPSSMRKPVPNYLRALNGHIRGLRMGIPRVLFFDDLHPEVEELVRKAVIVLEELGAITVDISLPTAVCSKEAKVTTFAEAAAIHGRWLRELPRTTARRPILSNSGPPWCRQPGISGHSGCGVSLQRSSLGPFGYAMCW